MRDPALAPSPIALCLRCPLVPGRLPCNGTATKGRSSLDGDPPGCYSVGPFRPSHFVRASRCHARRGHLQHEPDESGTKARVEGRGARSWALKGDVVGTSDAPRLLSWAVPRRQPLARCGWRLFVSGLAAGCWR